MNNTELQTKYHPTALVDDGAIIGQNVQIGPYSIVEPEVSIGDQTIINSHVLVASGSILGRDCQISNGAVIGTAPQDLKFQGEKSQIIVGDRTVIREFCTMNRGTQHGGMMTQVGSDCLLMAYVHVAHDCMIHDHVILANAVNMAGHVEIQEHASIGGMCVIHQFTRIGKYAFIGGMTRIAQDVPPFILTTSEPMKYYGPNAVGLRRKGFSDEQIRNIKKAYSFIYRSKLNLKQALDAIRNELEITAEVREIIEFIESSERGIFRSKK